MDHVLSISGLALSLMNNGSLEPNICSFLLQVRYAYEKTDIQGFIEMTPEWSAGDKKDVIRKFRQALLAVPGVTQVRMHPLGSKTTQGNMGNHYQDHNFAVYTKESGTKYLEFELTRNHHLDSASTFTVSALFKMPPKHLAKDAWWVLRGACLQNALLPEIVNKNYNQALRAIGLEDPEDASFATLSITTPKTSGQPASDAGVATSEASSSKDIGVPSLPFAATAKPSRSR